MESTARAFTPTRPALAGALGSAVLLTLAQPPFSILPLPFLALVPLSVGLASLPPGPSGRWQATLLGLLFGVAFWGFALIWVPLEVGPFFAWAYPGYALLLVLLGGLSALFGWVAHYLHKERALSLGLAVPLAWVGVEWIKAHFPFGLAFPWLGLGVSLSGWPQILGLAEWTGEAGVSFWLAAVSGLLAGMMSHRKGLRGISPWLLVGGVALFPAGLGWLRARTLPLDEGPNVVVVGTQVAREFRGFASLAAREAMAQVSEALMVVRPGTMDLVVLPEATFPFSIDGEEAPGARETMVSLTERLKASVVVGALGLGRSTAGAETFTNSVYLFAPGDPVPQKYDKSRLVPGMESGFSASEAGPVTLEAGQWVVGPLLCYESLFGGAARKARKEGAQILVNLSSDIWFGRETATLGGMFLQQHPAHLVVRAVENRVSVARAANGGFSLILDPRGRVISDAIPPGGGVTAARAPFYRGRTLFSRTGDWVGPGSVLLCLVLLLAGTGGAARRGDSGTQNGLSPSG